MSKKNKSRLCTNTDDFYSELERTSDLISIVNTILP